MKWIHVPLWMGLLPIVGVTVSYLLAIAEGHVASCFPFIKGCTSISSTGRSPPEAYVFRATLIPSAILLVLYWRLVYVWLRGAGGSLPPSVRVLPYLGAFAAVFLLIYANVVGAIGEVFALQRRIGVTVFFASNMLAQMLFTRQLLILRQQGHIPRKNRIPDIKLWLCGLMLACGLLILPKYLTGWDTDNIVEWNVALLGHLYFLATYALWRTLGTQPHISSRGQA